MTQLHRGWAVAAVVFMTFALTIGITQYSFGVFVTELESDLGWNRAELNTHAVCCRWFTRALRRSINRPTWCPPGNDVLLRATCV